MMVAEQPQTLIEYCTLGPIVVAQYFKDDTTHSINTKSTKLRRQQTKQKSQTAMT